MTMRERIARAIKSTTRVSPFPDGPVIDAVLDAMREPTEAMTQQGAADFHRDSWRNDMDDDICTPEEYQVDKDMRDSFERSTAVAWRTMVDAIEAGA